MLIVSVKIETNFKIAMLEIKTPFKNIAKKYCCWWLSILLPPHSLSVLLVRRRRDHVRSSGGAV